MDVDPLASMRCWVVEVQLAGRVFEIPALPAADWWPVLISGRPDQVLNLVASDPLDPDNLDDLLLSSGISEEELVEASIDAVEEVSGRSVQAAYILCAVAEKNWPVVNGSLARSGFRWDKAPIGAALDAIYSLFVEGMKEADRTKFDALLNRPSSVGRRPVDKTQAMGQFEAIAGPKPTTGARSSGVPSGDGPPRTRPRRRQVPRGDQ